MKQQSKLILFLIILFIASSVWLFHASQKSTDSNNSESWWALYFENPNDSSLNFVIENHSDKTDFHWKLTDGKNVFEENEVKIEKGKTTNISVDGAVSGKNIIEVELGKEKKEIYKNL